MTQVFYMEETQRERRYLRRFAQGFCTARPGAMSYHNSMVLIGEGERVGVISDDHPHDDPRWPDKCECGYTYTADDNWQLFRKTVYARSDDQTEYVMDEFPVGACWNLSWLAGRRRVANFHAGSDGRCLMVRTPGGDWCIDSRANNCTMRDDNEHQCWVRHGSPEAGDLHVDKNGHTCAAGAGSIVIGDFHGFLHHGVIRPC